MLESLLRGRKFEFPVERAVFLTVMHRLMVSGSDRAAERWCRGYAVEGLEEIELQHLYRAMGWLGEPLPDDEQPTDQRLGPRCRKDRIEELLFACRRDLFSGLQVAFFDTTSFLLPGNTADIATLVPVVDQLRTRFGIERVCVVADRGLISAETIRELETRKWQYILGARLRSVKEIREEVLSRAGRYHVVQGPREKSHDPSPLRRHDSGSCVLQLSGVAADERVTEPSGISRLGRCGMASASGRLGRPSRTGDHREQQVVPRTNRTARRCGSSDPSRWRGTRPRSPLGLKNDN